MISIEQKAIETFQNNMLYLQKEHPETFKKLNILNQAIQNGKYRENFALEHKDGYFDVLDLNTKEWLYGKSSIEKSKELAKDINFKKDNGVIETFYNYQFDEKAIEAANNEDPTASQFVLTAPILGFTTNLIKKQTTMKKIYKFIFFGVGLGLHIEQIHQKADAYMYLIIEDNLEIFRLSLFVTDFSTIGKNSQLYFSIMSNEAELKNIFDSFYHNSFIRNGYLKYSLFYKSYREKISLIQKFIVSQSSNTYLHDKLLQKNERVIKSIEQKYKYFNMSIHHKDPVFLERPVILVAAGPSLDRNIEWLKENAPYCLVIALFMTLPTLEKHQIKPDIIVHIDEGAIAVSNTLAKLKNPDFFSSSIYFLAPSVEFGLFSRICKKDSTFLFEDRTRYRFKKGRLEGFSVGETTYALSLIFGAKDIYLLGLDLALDFKTKKTHARGHDSINTEQKLKQATSSNTVSLRGSEFFVKGNFREKVPTIPLFDMSRNMLNTFTKELKKEYQSIYNLNEGAYFDNTIPTKTEDVNFSNYQKKDFINTNQTLLTFFNANASSEIDADEMSALRKRLEDAISKRDEITLVFKRKYPTMEQFQNAFVTLSSKLILPLSDNINELSQIYVIYLENIGSQIGDFLNTKEINNPKRQIKQFQKIISAQFLKIVNKYIDILENSNLLKD